MNCVAPTTGSRFLGATLEHLDCQAQSIGEAGYLAVASPGSPFSLALSALLAIFVAIIGIRFLIGRPLNVGEWISGVLKLGFVLALATSWPAYHVVVYDLVLKGPAEISSAVGRAAGLPGSDGRLMERLGGVDNGIMALVEAGSGRLDIASQRPTDAIAPPLSDDTALGWGKTVFVTSIIGSFGFLRLAGGLFLALAPFFAGFLLFDATRFLFFGWLRALISVAVSSVGLAVVLGFELAIVEPWLSQVLTLRAARIATLGAPFELLALTLSFSFAMLGVFALALRIGFASPVVTRMQAVIERVAYGNPNATVASQSATFESSAGIGERTRAQVVAQSLRQAISRDGQNVSGSGGDAGGPIRTPTPANDRKSTEIDQHVPLGRSYHAPSRRVSSQALKRKPAT
jgi:type IV secretion system protein VirB6